MAREDNRADNATRQAQLDNAAEIQRNNNIEPPPDTTTARDVADTVQREVEDTPPIIVPEGEDVTTREEQSVADQLVIDERADNDTEQQVAETLTNVSIIAEELNRTVVQTEVREVTDIVQQVRESVTTENVAQVRDVVQQVVAQRVTPQQALRQIAETVVEENEVVERIDRISIVGPTGPPLITPRVEREVPRTRPRNPDQERLEYGQSNTQQLRETTNSLLQFTDDLKTMNYILKKFNPIIESDLFTPGGQFIDTKFREYVGPYHKMMDGTLMKGEGKVGMSHGPKPQDKIVPGGPFTDPELLEGRRSYVPPEIVAEVSEERSRRRAARRRGERPGNFESRVEGLKERRRDPRDRVRSIGPEQPRIPGGRPPGYGRSNESRPPVIDVRTAEIERQAERILEQNDRDAGFTPPGREADTDRTAFTTDIVLDQRAETPDQRSQTPIVDPPARTEPPSRSTPPDREDSREEQPIRR